MADQVVKMPERGFWKRIGRLLDTGRAGPSRPKLAQDASPFAIPDPPPWVRRHVPEKSRLAMDQEINGADGFGIVPWAGAQQLESAYLEGLAFLGYPYLAQLALRSEYRHIV